MSKPIVAHMMRNYLNPTETFIGNQIYSHNDYKPIVLCRNRRHNPSYPFAELYCIEEHSTAWRKRLSNIAYAALLLSPYDVDWFVDILKKHGVNIIHFHFAVDARLFLSVKRKSGLPAVVSCYGYDVSFFPGKYFGLGKYYLRPIFSEMKFFIAMTSDMAKDLIAIGCPINKIKVHYYGIDIDRFSKIVREYRQTPPVKLLITASINRKKGHLYILEALNKVRQFVPLQLRIVGDGPLKTEILRYVQSHSLQNVVTLLGHIPHDSPTLLEEYKNADIFLHPSITTPDGDKEGIPGTIVEAMASGLPVVSTFHAGIPDVIQDEVSGLLVEERDINGLALCIQRLAEDPKLRMRYGKNARNQAVKLYDMREKILDLENIYNQLL